MTTKQKSNIWCHVANITANTWNTVALYCLSRIVALTQLTISPSATFNMARFILFFFHV